MKRPRTPGAGITRAHISLGSDSARSIPFAGRPYQPRGAGSPRGRTLTIARLIDRLTSRTGTPPTDAELAALLATSPKHIRRHRDLLARLRR
jgi:hypothetical protein